MADVIAMYICGRCCYISLLLADVIANIFVADVITTCNTKADVIACYISLLLADVIANTFVADVMTTYYSIRRSLFWLMLLPCISVVDVITTEADVIACYILFYLLADVIANICGRCYSHFFLMWWQMLLPSGRWNNHCRVGC